jgi:predicted membrane-bound dolichyl-phosphate-mannose-protein mannosyltransferase
MSTFSSAAATGAGAAIAGATTVLATVTGAGAAMTGAGAATAAAVVAVAEAVDFLVVFLGAVAELDICISVFEEVFGAYKRGNDDGN